MPVGANKPALVVLRGTHGLEQPCRLRIFPTALSMTWDGRKKHPRAQERFVLETAATPLEKPSPASPVTHCSSRTCFHAIFPHSFSSSGTPGEGEIKPGDNRNHRVLRPRHGGNTTMGAKSGTVPVTHCCWSRTCFPSMIPHSFSSSGTPGEGVLTGWMRWRQSVAAVLPRPISSHRIPPCQKG